MWQCGQLQWVQPLSSASGSVSGSGGVLPAFVHAYSSVSCDQTATTANAANYIGQSFSLGNGAPGGVFNLV